MAKSKWTLPDFSAIISEYEAIPEDMNGVARECIEAGLTIQYNAMMDGLAPHRLTGAAMEALTKEPVQRKGNRTFANIFIAGTRPTDMNGFWAAWFQEYGAARQDNGKILFKKDPWFRPAIDKNKSLIQGFWRAIFDKRGYPMK